MIKIELYKGIRNQLLNLVYTKEDNTTDKIKTVALWRNQLARESEEIPFLYPAVFIEFLESSYMESSSKIYQTVEMTVRLHICFESYLTEDLDILNLTNKVFSTLQLKQFETYGLLKRRSEDQNFDHPNVQDYIQDYDVSLGKDYGAEPTFAEAEIDNLILQIEIEGQDYPPSIIENPIISGATSLGSLLTCTQGYWNGTLPLTYTYQWKRNGVNITGATSSTYTIVIADSSANITCQVTATNIIGTSSASSNTITAQAFNAPANTIAPVISGTIQENQVITCSTGTWTGYAPITYTYQWKKNNVNIVGATSSSYTVVSGDVGQSIKCTVTATNIVGANSTDSNVVVPISALDPNALAFITTAGITNPTQQAAINTLVTDLKANNLWTKMKALYPMVGGTASSHSYNLKNPAQFQITWSGGITHSSNGVLPNGTNGFGNTNFNPSLNLTTSSAHQSFYFRTNRPISKNSEYGCSGSGSSKFALYPYTWSTGWISDIFDSTTSRIISSAGNSTGYVIGTRSSSSSHKLFRNNTQIASTSNSTTGNIPNANYILFSSVNESNIINGYYDDNQIAFGSLGDGLTDAESSTLYTIIQAFQTTLGRQV
jgi:hypothetical protein